MAEYFKSLYADADLKGIWFFIANDNAEAASKVLRAAHATFELLARNPGIGRVRPWSRGFHAFPVKGFPNYLILYREKEGKVEIHRVLHGAQDLKRILENEQPL